MKLAVQKMKGTPQIIANTRFHDRGSDKWFQTARKNHNPVKMVIGIIVRALFGIIG